MKKRIVKTEEVIKEDDLDFDDWQRDVLNSKGHIIICTGRQVGKTTIMARKAAMRMIEQKNQRIIIVSLTEDQAKLIIVMILDYLEKFHKDKIQKGKHKPTQNKVTLKNNSSVLARPVGNTGDAVRGFTGDVLIIDEASRMPELVWTASRPTLLTTAGEIWMCSTPFGKQGYFWEAFQNKNERFTVFHISSEEVITNRTISKSWTQKQRDEAIKFLDGEKKEMSELEYGQEYLGLFLDDLRQYFPDELINECCTEERQDLFSKKFPTFLGVDIARMGDDETTYQIIQKKDKNRLIHIESIIKVKQLTTKTEQQIIDLDKIYNFQKIYIDAGAGSLGVGIFDHLLENEQTKRKIEAINNRARSLNRDDTQKARILKEDLYDNLRALMERGFIKLLNDDKVKASLKSVQYEFVKKEGQPTKMRIFGRDTHVVEGLIRAAVCSKDKNLNIWIKSIRV